MAGGGVALLYLVRHGETAGNAERVMQTPEIPLSPRGVAQARRLAERLRDVGIARVLSSDLTRAEMTANLLCHASGASLELDPLLQERNFGSLRGTPYARLAEDPFAPGYTPPEGESWEVFDARVDRAWRRIRSVAAGCGGSLAIVTHGLVCGSLVRRHLRLAAGAPAPAGFRNASLTIAGARPPHEIRLLDCIAHLEGIAAADGSAA